ncbi:unnamed protein product, partial [Scytosiphon promiscuus]
LDLAFREIKIKTKHRNFGQGLWGMFVSCPPPCSP